MRLIVRRYIDCVRIIKLLAQSVLRFPYVYRIKGIYRYSVSIIPGRSKFTCMYTAWSCSCCRPRKAYGTSVAHVAIQHRNCRVRQLITTRSCVVCNYTDNKRGRLTLWRNYCQPRRKHHQHHHCIVIIIIIIILRTVRVLLAAEFLSAFFAELKMEQATASAAAEVERRCGRLECTVYVRETFSHTARNSAWRGAAAAAAAAALSVCSHIHAC